MRTEQQRDAQTVTIATGLAIFVGVIVVGALIGWLVHIVSGVSDAVATALTVATLVLASGSTMAYLHRHRRP